MPTLRQLFLNNVAQTSHFPQMLEVERADGVYIYDREGKAYMDLIAGIGVSAVGHGHPKVIAAIKNQLGKYLHTMVYGEHIQSPQVRLAKKLTDQLPSRLNSVYFVNSGSEAVEGAMKLAKRYTGRYELVACRNAYHGSTQGANSLMSDQTFTRGYQPLLPGVKFMTFNNQEDIAVITEKTAGVIVETVQGEAGVILPDEGYLRQLRQQCDETGALLIFDEIQAGFGRTGHLFAFEKYGIVPDILLLAKGMGGGMPIGAFIANRKVMDVLSHNPVLGHITTFGGHPVSCAAGIAALEVINDKRLLRQVVEKEALFHHLLHHEKVKEIRSAGLMMAVDLDDEKMVQDFCQKTHEMGLLTDWFLFNETSFRIAPPLTITTDEIKKASKIILKALDDL